MRKIFPFRSPWPPMSWTPWTSRRRSRNSPTSRPSGARIAVTTAERSSSGEKSSRPIAFTPARQARPRRTCRSNAASSPSSRIIPSAASSASTSGTAGVNGASSFACADARALPVEDEARGRAARRALERRRRDRRRTTRPGGVISAFCEPETTTSMPHASVSTGTAPRLETASTTTSAPPSFATSAERLDVRDDAGRGLGMGQEDGVRAAGRPRACARRSSGWGVSPHA